MASAKRLLVIDDEPAFGSFVKEVAEGMGYDVRVTAKADEFADAYETFDPTVIVLDVVMPEVDGIELVQWLAQEKCKAKIVIVTGYNPHYADAAKRLVSAGDLRSVMTLTKPVSLADLRAALS
jgi:CheY-like chemotaxis protein